MRKKGDNSFKSAGKSAIPPDKRNDFILGLGSQWPARRMGENLCRSASGVISPFHSVTSKRDLSAIAWLKQVNFRLAGDTPQVLNPQSLLAGDDYVSV
jgi:hypothetical protein